MSAINFIDAISRFYPDIKISTTGIEYDAIDWGTHTPIPKAVLVQHITNFAKEEKIAELSAACQNAIISGFQSDALGEPRIYDSEEVDQLNLIGAVTSISSGSGNEIIYYASRSLDGNKTYDSHTYPQIKQVLLDGAIVKLGHLQKFFMLKMMVYATEIPTIDDCSILDNIKWQ